MLNRPDRNLYQKVQFHSSPNLKLQPAGGLRTADYTLGHAGRQVRVGPIAFWITVGTLAIMAAWTLATGTYFAFREDVLTRLIARQADMQFAYEDRIAELRTQVDHLSSRHLLDQEQYDQRLEQVVRRQTQLESRAGILNALPDPTATGSIRQPTRGSTARGVPPKPSPINDSTSPAPPTSLRGARLDLRAPEATGSAAGLSNKLGDTNGLLARLQTSLDRVEARQGFALAALQDRFDSKARRIRQAFTDAGIDKMKASAPAGVGGPFVAARPPTDATPFERQVYGAQVARAEADELTRILGSVPLRRPLNGDDISSGFGVRIDPFTHSTAMHTGIDFRGETGEPIRTTASGKVTTAGWEGGYGRMVEIDHGNGLATRYGHLSEIDVQVGQTVKIGQVVGRLGSTGRATGPHLHYETRVAGEPVDPLKFLRAGAKLAGDL